MNTNRKPRLGTAALALTLCLAAGSAMAHDDRDRRHDRRGYDGPGHSQRFDRGDDRRDHRHGQRADHRRDFRGPPVAVHRVRPAPIAHPHAYPQAQWRRGAYLPVAYHAPRYVVNDWRAHRLHQPPRGHQWVNVDGSFVLAAIAGGLIAHVIASQ